MRRFRLLLPLGVVALVLSSCAVGVRDTAVNVTTSSATLRGLALSTTGGPGSYFVEYGETLDRSERTPTRSTDFTVGTLVPVREDVTGLDPGTTYHYAVCAEDAENPGDPFCSPDQTFTTRYAPALAVTRNCASGNGIRTNVTGMPANTDFEMTVHYPSGPTPGQSTFTTDADGNHEQSIFAAADGTWTVSVELPGYLPLGKSIYVDCDAPPSSSDSVVGTGQAGADPAPTFFYTADAHSGPSGEGPGGTLYWRYQRGNQGEVHARVTCLVVDGDTAVIGFTGLFGGVFNGKASIAGRALVTDRDGAADTFESAINTRGPSVDWFDPDPAPIPGPSDCTTFPGTLPPNNSTDVRTIDVGGGVVTDTVPSSSSRR